MCMKTKIWITEEAQMAFETFYVRSRDVPDTTLPDTGFNRIVIYRIPDILDTG